MKLGFLICCFLQHLSSDCINGKSGSYTHLSSVNGSQYLLKDFNNDDTIYRNAQGKTDYFTDFELTNLKICLLYTSGSSAPSKSGAKVRPKGVADAQPVDIPLPSTI